MSSHQLSITSYQLRRLAVMVANVVTALVMIFAANTALAQDFVTPGPEDPSTPRALESFANDTPWYDPTADFSQCADAAGVPVASTQTQDGNANIIIGIAKTYNLGREGALIGLMTGITESRLRNEGSTIIPLSQTAPGVQGLGSDHDSVGIMQQRPSTGWSTFSTGGQSALLDKDVIYQLMTPAYAAQAFFGTPKGAILPAGLVNPHAIQKGLQNISGWQNLDPWVAAQRVQISGFPDGSNYKKHLAEAQSMLARLYDSAVPIPLPIPISSPIGGTTAAPVVGKTDCNTVDPAGLNKLMTTIVAYVWPTYHKAPYYIMRQAYADAVKAAQAKGDYVGGNQHPGIDCGGFVTLVFRNSGVDPQYNKYQAGTYYQQLYLNQNPTKYQNLGKVSGTGALKQGDIAIKNINGEGHTYIYVGKVSGLQYDSVSASLGNSAGNYWRTPMSSTTYGFDEFTWYRPLAK